MIGERIKSLRESLGQSQEELAHSVGMHPNTVARWERGELTPRGTSLSKIARALNTTSTYLLGETDDSSAVNPQGSLKPARISVVSERAVTEKDRALVYEDGGKRFEFPPTPEGYEMFRELMDRIIPVSPAIAK